MSLATPNSRRRQREDGSESEDEISEDRSRTGTPFSQNSNGSKRVRTASNLNGTDGSEEEGPGDHEDASTESSGEINGTAASSSAIPPSFPSTANGVGNGSIQRQHRPGAIVRVKLINFVTYTSVECFPGPRLNMVIGPNGTGKSTFVCAICLGMGWGPQYLGRAKDVGEFVKHGKDEAIIEIELEKGGRFRQNPVICRTIKRKGNKSTFTINGKTATNTNVRDLAKSFSIQIDNLCQFLPQDKVSEFAALSPVDLLHSTQRAAAGPEMIEWHENLKTLRGEQKNILNRSAGDKELLANLESRQQVQREDVERMKQRDQIKKRLGHLELLRPAPRYKQVKEQYDGFNRNMQNLSFEKTALEERLEPALRAVNDKKAYYTELEGVVKQQRVLVQRGDDMARKISNKMIAAEDKMKELNRGFEATKNTGKVQLEETKRLTQIINRIQRQMEEEPVEYDAAAFAEKIRDRTRERRDLEEKTREFQDRKDAINKEFHNKRTRVIQDENRLKSLASHSGQQEEKLRKLSRDSYEAWQWIKNNQDRFQKQVFGPPCVECSVKDPRYARAIESLVGRNDMMAFTTQSREDFRTLQRILNSELKLHDFSIKTSTMSLSQLAPQVSESQLRQFGFDGLAKDFITGPEPVIALLCSENRFNQTPISLRDITDEEFQALQNSSISTWVTSKQSFQIIRRHEYGPSATSTRVRPLRPAQTWTNGPAEGSNNQELQNQVNQGKQELTAIKGRLDELERSNDRIKEEFIRIDKEKAQLEQEKQAKQTALTNFRALPTKLEQAKEKLNASEERVRARRDDISKLRDEQDEYALARAAAAVEYTGTVQHLRKLHEELIKVEIMSIEALSDYETLNERNSDINKTLEAKKIDLDAAAMQVMNCKKTLLAVRDQLRTLVRERHNDADFNAVLVEVGEFDVDQLEAEIDSEAARLELTHAGNDGIIQEFEQRQRRIDSLRQKLGESEETLEELRLSIAEIRGQWEPRLDELVGKISEAFADSFSRIKCAGQVSVDKNEGVLPIDPTGNTTGGSNSDNDSTNDFDQWSIRIQVKFREHESLSVLDSHRQSGGERAVSTIFYLMALQSLSASPFRVVDEINQGMDPRNERMVHGRMVDIACGQADSDVAGGQYFLITPKLLSGLSYRRGMSVLCIFSGEYMPVDSRRLDLRDCVGRQRRFIEGKRVGVAT